MELLKEQNETNIYLNNDGDIVIAQANNDLPDCFVIITEQNLECFIEGLKYYQAFGLPESKQELEAQDE